MFDLLCHGSTHADSHVYGQLSRFGGPILYLFLTGFVLLGVIVWVDSGSRRFYVLRQTAPGQNIAADEEKKGPAKEDVAAEAEAVANSKDALRMLHVSKSFGRNVVLDDVTLGVPVNTGGRYKFASIRGYRPDTLVVFALLGPNGAGKTTAFNIIRECEALGLLVFKLTLNVGGDLIPNAGDVFIKGISVVDNPQAARVSLGVCPQFSAIDSHLTVRQHLYIYGRLKGLRPGLELDENTKALMRATGIEPYADRLANKLSGGNKRKLALAIALMG